MGHINANRQYGCKCGYIFCQFSGPHYVDNNTVESVVCILRESVGKVGVLKFENQMNSR